MIYRKQCMEIGIQSDADIIIGLRINQYCFIGSAVHLDITDMRYFAASFFHQVSRRVRNALIKQDFTHAASRAIISSSR